MVGFVRANAANLYLMSLLKFTRRARWMGALLLGAIMSVAPAQAQTVAAPQINAKAWALYDVTAHTLLGGERIAERIDPASLTKMMTAYLVFGALKAKTITLEQAVPVSPRAWKAIGSRMFIEPKTPVTVAELLRGMIIQSGNDASIALAELVAGS